MDFSIKKSNSLINCLLDNQFACNMETSSFTNLEIRINGEVINFSFSLITDNLDNYSSYQGELLRGQLPNYWAKYLHLKQRVHFSVEEIVEGNKFLGYELRD